MSDIILHLILEFFNLIGLLNWFPYLYDYMIYFSWLLTSHTCIYNATCTSGNSNCRTADSKRQLFFRYVEYICVRVHDEYMCARGCCVSGWGQHKVIHVVSCSHLVQACFSTYFTPDHQYTQLLMMTLPSLNIGKTTASLWPIKNCGSGSILDKFAV